MEILEEEQRIRLLRTIHEASIGPHELWVQYGRAGGIVGNREVEAYIYGLMSLPPLERDLLGRAAGTLIGSLFALPGAVGKDEPPPPPTP
jgi:hypothetical protein